MSSFYNAKNSLYVMVSTGTSVTAATTKVNGYADLQAGEIAIVDADNKCLTNAGTNITDTQKFRFVNRVGTNLIYSPFITNSQIVSAIAESYLAATQQVSYIGYIGSGTGNIQALDNNEYIVRLLLKTDTTSMFGNKQMYKFGAYKSGSGATSAEVAIGLVDSLYYNFKREAEQAIKFAAICNATVTTANGFKSGQEVTVVQGENFVTCETDVTYTSGGTSTLVVGDYLRIGSATDTNAAMTLTSGVYLVTKISGLQVFLDRPVTAASGIYDDAGGTPTIEVIPSATGLAATWGIKCTGVALTKTKEGVFNYEVPTFTIEPQNCGTTTVTYTTAAVRGKGTYEQVAELEWFAQGNLGNKWRIAVPPAAMYKNATSGNTYETLLLKIKTDSVGESIGNFTPNSYFEIMLCFKVNSSDGDSVKLALEDLTNVAFAAWS